MCLKKKSDGYLMVDLSGDTAPLQLNLNLGISDLLTRKRITLDIRAKDIPTAIDYVEDDKDYNS